jgi:choline dehydrogenase-like flavoprotein
MIDTSNKEIQSQYDFIVVGAGAAGSVLAAELSASGAQVLLIESGGPDDGPTIANPSIWFYNVAGPLDYHLPINPSPRLNNRKFNMPSATYLVAAPASMPWCGCVICNGTTTGGRRMEPRGGPSPTCFRSSRNKRIGKAARMNCAVLVARYTFAGQKILTQPRPLSSTQPARWACPFWPT